MQDYKSLCAAVMICQVIASDVVKTWITKTKTKTPGFKTKTKI